jgi:hypothetical protein
MNKTLNYVKPAAEYTIQPPYLQDEITYSSTRDQDDSAPYLAIKGDLRVSVTEQEAAQGPIIRNYHLETGHMQEPLSVLWEVEGEVLPGTARSTDIAFDLSGVHAGQQRTYVVTVQLTEPDGQQRQVSGTFVQIFVRPDSVLQEAA